MQKLLSKIFFGMYVSSPIWLVFTFLCGVTVGNIVFVICMLFIIFILRHE